MQRPVVHTERRVSIYATAPSGGTTKAPSAPPLVPGYEMTLRPLMAPP